MIILNRTSVVGSLEHGEGAQLWVRSAADHAAGSPDNIKRLMRACGALVGNHVRDSDGIRISTHPQWLIRTETEPQAHAYYYSHA